MKREFEALPEDMAGKIFVQIIEGVRHAHQRGVDHRDLKLENIMLTNEGKVKIIDWGLSTVGKDATPECVGTVDYVAPEVMTARSYKTNATDVFSLGVVLYTMMVGQFPFSYKSRLEYFRKKTVIHPTLPTTDSLNPKCAELLQKMLEIDPEKRISLKEVLQTEWVKPYTRRPERPN